MSFETSHIRALPNRRAAPSIRSTLLPAQADQGIGGEALGQFLIWLKLWFACVAEGVLTDVFLQYNPLNKQSGYQRPPSLLPDSERAAIAPQVLCGRRRRRIIARGIPASRRYDGLQYLNDRQLTGNQFLERACRLSVNGRVEIYGLEYRLRLCQRRHEVRRHRICGCFQDDTTAVPKAGLRERASLGLSVFHLRPS